MFRSAQNDSGFAFSFSLLLRSLRGVSSVRTNIVLIGFMGSGKSSIGRRVAGRLGFQFVDTDAVLVARDGRSIADIFAEEGEARFRDLEAAVLASLSAQNRCVISTGGGAVVREENRPLLRALGFVVWLTASEEVIFERVSRNAKRPLLQTANPRETIAQLLAARRPSYEAAAQFTVETSTLAHAAAAEAVIAEARRAFSWDTAG